MTKEPSIKAEKISAEFALIDALDHICKYLKIKDLLNVSLVCKLWCETASREIKKRGPERLLIPHTYSRDIIDRESNFHVYDMLNATPFVALLFVGPSLRERNNQNLESDVLAAYKKYFPRHLVTIGVDESMMDEDVIFSCPSSLGSPNGILGLFLPLYRDLNIKVYSESINALIPEDKESKSTLFLFCNSYQRYLTAEDVLRMIKIRFAQKMYSLWGGIFDDKLIAIDCKTARNINTAKQKTALFCLSITGPNLASWSTVIDCKIKKQEFEKKLTDFKDKLQLRGNTIGLACGPRYVEDFNNTSMKNMYHNSRELMNCVKKIFPSIPFNGIFNYGYHPHFGVDSTIDDTEQQLAHPMALSLMILTYD